MYNTLDTVKRRRSEELDSYLLGKRRVGNVVLKEANGCDDKARLDLKAMDGKDIATKTSLDPLLAIQREQYLALEREISSPPPKARHTHRRSRSRSPRHRASGDRHHRHRSHPRPRYTSPGSRHTHSTGAQPLDTAAFRITAMASNASVLELARSTRLAETERRERAEMKREARRRVAMKDTFVDGLRSQVDSVGLGERLKRSRRRWDE